MHFAGHCNQVDVIPILEWTQARVSHLEILWLCACYRVGPPGFSWFEVLLVMVTRMDVLSS